MNPYLWPALALALTSTDPGGFAPVPTAAPDPAPRVAGGPAESRDAPAPGSAIDAAGAPSTLDPVTVGLLTVGLAAAVGVAGRLAWWDEGTRPFHFIREGFFGAGTYAGGADKSGHLFSSYISVLGSSAFYEWAGVDHTAASWLGIVFSFAVWNGFEILGDGFTQYGASPEDMTMNLLGVTAGGLTRLWPTFERLIGLRIGYVPTRDFLGGKQHSPLKLINDYSGMLFYYDLKLGGLVRELGGTPGLSRYLLTGAVYEAWKYSPVLYRAQTRRGLGVHVSVALGEVLRAVTGGDPGAEKIARFFDFFAVPMLSIAVMEDLNHNRPYVNFGIANRLEPSL